MGDKAFQMRLNETNYRRAKAIAAVRGWPLRRVIETATREYYENAISDEERTAVDLVVSLNAKRSAEEGDAD